MSAWSSLPTPAPREAVLPATIETTLTRTARLLHERGWLRIVPYRYHSEESQPLTLLGAIQEACKYDVNCYAHSIDVLHDRIDCTDHHDHPSWTVKAVHIAEWEGDPARTIEEICNLLTM